MGNWKFWLPFKSQKRRRAANPPPPKAHFSPNKFHWNLETKMLFKTVQRAINNASRLDKKTQSQEARVVSYPFGVYKVLWRLVVWTLDEAHLTGIMRIYSVKTFWEATSPSSNTHLFPKRIQSKFGDSYVVQNCWKVQ